MGYFVGMGADSNPLSSELRCVQNFIKQLKGPKINGGIEIFED
jgi:hypothetical protein